MIVDQISRNLKLLQFAVLLVVFFFLYFSIDPSDNNILWRLPAYLAGVPIMLNNSVEYLMFEWFPVEIYNVDIEEYEEFGVVTQINANLGSFNQDWPDDAVISGG